VHCALCKIHFFAIFHSGTLYGSFHCWDVVKVCSVPCAMTHFFSYRYSRTLPYCTLRTVRVFSLLGYCTVVRVYGSAVRRVPGLFFFFFHISTPVKLSTIPPGTLRTMSCCGCNGCAVCRVPGLFVHIGTHVHYRTLRSLGRDDRNIKVSTFVCLSLFFSFADCHLLYKTLSYLSYTSNSYYIISITVFI
jgi:hypothetical protein